MANGYTPPKGRATAARSRSAGRSNRLPPTLEWVLLALVVLAVVAVALFFTIGSDPAQHNGAAIQPIVAFVAATPWR